MNDELMPDQFVLTNDTPAQVPGLFPWSAARRAEDYTVEMLGPNRDGDAPYRMSNGQVLLPATWGNYTPKRPPAALAAATEAPGEPISPRTAQYLPLDREVARAYGDRQKTFPAAPVALGRDTSAHLMMDNHAGAKAYEMRRFILDRMAEGYTVEMIDPKSDHEESNE